MRITDFLNRVYIDDVENEKIECDKCIFTLVSPGYEGLLDDMLLSLRLNGDVADAQLVVFVVNANEECLKVIKKYNGHSIYCHPLYNVHIDSKAIVYSAYKIVDANKYLFLDADTIVLNSLSPIFDQVGLIPDNNLLICEDQYFYGRVHTLGDAFKGTLYDGNIEDFVYLLGREAQREIKYSHIVNTGVWACKKQALQQINETIHTFYNVSEWSKGGFLREQFLVNLALAIHNSASILDISYNWQLVINTFLKYISNDKGYEVFVGYNLFALDYIESPWILINKLKQHEDVISKRLFDLLYPEQKKFLLNYDAQETQDRSKRYEQIQFLQFLLNGLMVNLTLFNDELLNKADVSVTEGLPSYSEQPPTVEISRINKEILKRCYFEKDEQYSDILYDSKINLLHFNGLNKGHGYTRTFFKNYMAIKENKKVNQVDTEGIKFVISTHRKYQDITLPRLLHSLIDVNGIPEDSILVVSGGWEEDAKYVKDHVLYHCVRHNSFDHTGLIDIVEKNLKSDYWFNFQDTCEAGINFWNKLKSFDNKDYEYVSVDNQGFLNMGLFSWDFLQDAKNYILSMKNCGKERAILSEKIYNKIAKSTTFNSENAVVFGYGDMYNTGLLRNMIYYVDIDLYKYQSNIVETMKVCNP